MQFCRIHKNSSETWMSVKSNTCAHMQCKYLKPKYSQLGVLPSLSLWKTWHVLSVVFAFCVWYMILYLILYQTSCVYKYMCININIYMKHHTLYTIYHIFLKMVYIYIAHQLQRTPVCIPTRRPPEWLPNHTQWLSCTWWLPSCKIASIF